ncbi:MAG TPA: M48 family metallopeptidase [Candidatus Dormibacteraeota bacterium]|nr:M48 family metallopeptidase [Candidatus Dormibacteraeota bacterium]
MWRCISNRRCILILLLTLFLGALARGHALDTANAPRASQSSQSESVTTPAIQLPESEQTETEQYTLSHDRYEKAVSYSRAAYALHFVSFFLSILVLFVVLRLGVIAKFRDIAENVSDKRWIQALLFVPLLLFTLDLFDLPVRIYWHMLSLRYQQSVQRWGSWLSDWAKEEVLGIAFALILVGLLVVAMRRSPRHWWLYFWFAALPVLLFIFFISPRFIDPLFNKFEPLDAQYPTLVTAIEKVSHRAGLQIPRERIFLMRASEKTNRLNAYVTGFGTSKRVVVWDTTIQKLTTDETLFIFGHEAGHYLLHHIRNSLLFFAATLLLAFYLLFRGLHWALHRWATNCKIYGPEDWASLAVLLLLLQVMAFFSSPVVNWYSRMQEHAADIYGLEVIHGIVPNSAEVAAHAFQVLGEVDLDDPNPPSFITFWLYSHPPLADRLIFAHSYDPWSKGEPPKYVK